MANKPASLCATCVSWFSNVVDIVSSLDENDIQEVVYQENEYVLQVHSWNLNTIYEQRTTCPLCCRLLLNFSIDERIRRDLERSTCVDIIIDIQTALDMEQGLFIQLRLASEGFREDCQMVNNLIFASDIRMDDVSSFFSVCISGICAIPSR